MISRYVGQRKQPEKLEKPAKSGKNKGHLWKSKKTFKKNGNACESEQRNKSSEHQSQIIKKHMEINGLKQKTAKQLKEKQYVQAKR